MREKSPELAAQKLVDMAIATSAAYSTGLCMSVQGVHVLSHMVQQDRHTMASNAWSSLLRTSLHQRYRATSMLVVRGYFMCDGLVYPRFRAGRNLLVWADVEYGGVLACGP